MGGAHLKGRTYEQIHGEERGRALREKRKQARWKGGRFKCDGYWMVYKPGHHLAGRDGYAPEHLLVAEEVLGRKLERDDPKSPECEVVHHLNGDRGDNRPENLLVCRRWFHTLIHQTIRNFLEKLHFQSLQGKSFTAETLTLYLEGFGLDPSQACFLGKAHLRRPNGGAIIPPLS